MCVLGVATCGILNYPEYVGQLLTVAIVNFPQRRAERAQGRQSGARRGHLNGEQNARTDVSRARCGRLNGEQPRGQPSGTPWEMRQRIHRTRWWYLDRE